MKKMPLNIPQSAPFRPRLANMPLDLLGKLGRLLGLSVVTSLLVACGLQELTIEPAAVPPTPSSSETAAKGTAVVESEEIPDMEETPVQETPLETPLCYLFAVHSEAQQGGRETQLATTYLAADGFIQASVQTSDHKILELREGRVGESAIIAEALDVIVAAKSADKPAPTPRPGDSIIVTEYSPPNLHLRLGSCDNGLVTEWSGPIDIAPDGVSDLAAEMQKLADQASAAEPSTGRYIRAQHLTPETVSQMEEAGILTTITPEELAGDDLLKKAMENPYRLIEVSETSDSNAAETTFQTGRSLNVLYGEQGYQVRHLIQDPS